MTCATTSARGCPPSLTAGSPSVLRIQANSAVLGTRQPSPTGPSMATRPSTSNAVLSFPSSTWPRSKNNTLTLSRPVAAKPKVWKAPRLPHRVELTSQEKKELIALKTENEFLRHYLECLQRQEQGLVALLQTQ
ncbi:hypothetical protein ACKKBF_B32340 [Auxenochlorella protothecoides x Auxenochlorella symbiontica]